MWLGNLLMAGGGLKALLSRTHEGGTTGLAIMLLGGILFVAGAVQRLFGKIASLLAYHQSRRQEYAADLIAAKLVSPEAYISALSKIGTFNTEFSAQKVAQLPFAEHWQIQPLNLSRIDGLFSTHPATEDRIDEIGKLYQYL